MNKLLGAGLAALAFASIPVSGQTIQRPIAVPRPPAVSRELQVTRDLKLLAEQPLKLQWAKSLADASLYSVVTFPPVVDEARGLVFTVVNERPKTNTGPANKETIRAISIADGAVRWTHARPPASITQQTLLMVSAHGNLYNVGSAGGVASSVEAFAADSGQVRWTYSHQNNRIAWIWPAGNELYVYFAGAVKTTSEIGQEIEVPGMLVSVNPANGQENWRFIRCGDGFGLPAAIGNELYVTQPQYGLQKFVNHAHPRAWYYNDAIQARQTVPLVIGDTVYVAGHRGLHALNTATGTKKWAVTFYGNSATYLTNVISANGIVYAVHSGTVQTPELCAYDAATGALKWSQLAPGVAEFRLGLDSDQVVISGPTVYVLGSKLHAFDAQSGRARAGFDQQFRGIATTGNNGLLAMDGNGTLHYLIRP